MQKELREGCRGHNRACNAPTPVYNTKHSLQSKPCAKCSQMLSLLHASERAHQHHFLADYSLACTASLVTDLLLGYVCAHHRSLTIPLLSWYNSSPGPSRKGVAIHTVLNSSKQVAQDALLDSDSIWTDSNGSAHGGKGGVLVPELQTPVKEGCQCGLRETNMSAGSICQRPLRHFRCARLGM